MIGLPQSVRWDLAVGLEGYPSCFHTQPRLIQARNHFVWPRYPSWYRIAAGPGRPDARACCSATFRKPPTPACLDPRLRRIPIVLRGDSHNLAGE